MLRRVLFALLASWALLGLSLSGSARAAHAPADAAASIAMVEALAATDTAASLPAPADAAEPAVSDNLPVHELPEALVAGLPGLGAPRPGLAPVGPPSGHCPRGAPEHLLRPPSTPTV